MRAKKLIVNADDFGQSKGINKGIIQAHEKGIVTSASLMVRYPAAMEAVAYAKTNSTLGIGLHLDLGEWVCKDENWEMSYCVVNLADKDAVRKEIVYQVDRFFEIMGGKPTHIDSHQHTHLSTSILPIVEEVAKDLDITLRGCSSKVHYCGNFYGQSDSGSPHHEIISVEGLRRIFRELPDSPITELGCHPAFDNDVDTMYRLEREIELETLCNTAIKADLAAQGYELCSFDGITF